MASLTISVVTATFTPSHATMTATVTATPPINFSETKMAFRAAFGIFNIFAGFLVIGIIGFSYLAIIPILSCLGSFVSAPLNFAAYVLPNISKNGKVASGIGADLSWLLQEGIIPLYSFIIVRMLV